MIISAAIVPVAAIRSAAADTTNNAKTSALTPDQLKLVEAFADRLIPKDENGPSASECVRTLHRSPAGGLSRIRENLLRRRPNSTNAFAMKSHGKNFVDLTPDMQDMVLTAIDGGTARAFTGSRAFFNRFRRLTLEGTSAIPTTAAIRTSQAGI